MKTNLIPDEHRVAITAGAVGIDKTLREMSEDDSDILPAMFVLAGMLDALTDYSVSQIDSEELEPALNRLRGKAAMMWDDVLRNMDTGIDEST